MDDATLASLVLALGASPDNDALALVVFRAQVERDEHEAARVTLGDREPARFADAERAAIAELLVRIGDAERALDYADGDAPPLLLARARALVELSREKEAREAYDRAIAANASLEDPALRAKIAAPVVRLPTHEDGPRLRVVSNDDTRDEEVNRLVHPELEPVTFADVGGLDDVKDQIRKRIIAPFEKPTLFARFRKRVGGGILMYGPPGCGKTLLARATAGECGAEFYNVAISDVLDMWIGESERKLKSLFEQARRRTPAVLFFDEIEALGGKRQYTREATSSRIVSMFLAEMDGFARENHGVLILGATNVPWAVDPAFRRPGRFDRVMFVPPPDRVARARVLEILLADRPVASGIDTAAIAAKTSGFSGADLEHLVETAADLAIEERIERGEELPISEAHLRDAAKEVKPTTTEWLTTARNYARYANEGGQYDDVLAFLDANARR